MTMKLRNHKLPIPLTCPLFSIPSPPLRMETVQGQATIDQISLTSFATSTSKLTVNIGSFQDPIFQNNKEVVVDDNDTAMLPPPVARIPASSPGAAFSISAITSDSLQGLPGTTESVSSAPPSIPPRSNSQALSPAAATGVLPLQPPCKIQE